MKSKLKITAIEPGTVQDYSKQASGRCHRCNTRFIWAKKLGKLKDMLCPYCNIHLEQTTHLFKGKTCEIREE